MDRIMRSLRSLGAKIYGPFKYPDRLTYTDALHRITTPFQGLTYLERWFRYRANEDSKYNCLSPEEVWSDKMLDEDGKHWDDCDGYAAAMIDPLNLNGNYCAILCMFTRSSGHATLLLETKSQMMTLGTFGLWCHGSVEENQDSITEIAQSFYSDPVQEWYICDRDWNVMIYGRRVYENSYGTAWFKPGDWKLDHLKIPRGKPART